MPLVERFNGEFLKELGDGTPSSFPSALAAVRAAIQLQRSLAVPILVRIGIYSSDVVVSEGDVLGDGVNIASRIEPLSEPVGICITEPVFDAVRN